MSESDAHQTDNTGGGDRTPEITSVCSVCGGDALIPGDVVATALDADTGEIAETTIMCERCYLSVFDQALRGDNGPDAPEDEEVEYRDLDEEFNVFDLVDGELQTQRGRLASIEGRNAARGWSPEDARDAREIRMRTAFTLALVLREAVRGLAVECLTLYGIVTGVDASWCDAEDLMIARALAARDRSDETSEGRIFAIVVSDPFAEELLTSRRLFASLVGFQSAFEQPTSIATARQTDDDFEQVIVILGLRYPAPIQLLASDILDHSKRFLVPTDHDRTLPLRCDEANAARDSSNLYPDSE